MEYGFDEKNRPFIRYENKVFHGFLSSERERNTFHMLKSFLPHGLMETHYRLMRDFLTRYIYPHTMPTLKPNYSTFFLSGFHGQHKDAIDDIRDKSLRNKLREVFRIKDDDIIINGGAYIGFGDLRVSELIPNGMMVSVEAEKKCFNLLQLNLKRNGIKNVIPLNNALWSESIKKELSTTDLEANSLVGEVIEQVILNRQLNVSDIQQTINCITVDDIVKSNSLKKVDFVSLTLNGAEVETLDGMKETLSVHKPRIRLPGWYLRNGVPIWKLCSEKLKTFNYKVVVGKRGSVFAYYM